MDDIRLPLTILLGALIVGGVVGVVGISMQPKYEDSQLRPITVETPQSTGTPPPTSVARVTTVPTSAARATTVPTSAASVSSDVPAPPPATFEPVEAGDDGGHHRGGDDHGGDDGGHGGGDDHSGGGHSGPG